jgi:hypothetical protein
MEPKNLLHLIENLRDAGKFVDFLISNESISRFPSPAASHEASSPQIREPIFSFHSGLEGVGRTFFVALPSRWGVVFIML